jgi:hypothetical protein
MGRSSWCSPGPCKGSGWLAWSCGCLPCTRQDMTGWRCPCCCMPAACGCNRHMYSNAAGCPIPSSILIKHADTCSTAHLRLSHAMMQMDPSTRPQQQLEDTIPC